MIIKAELLYILIKKHFYVHEKHDLMLNVGWTIFGLK